MKDKIFFPFIFIIALCIIAYSIVPLYEHKNYAYPSYTKTPAGLWIEGSNIMKVKPIDGKANLPNGVNGYKKRKAHNSIFYVSLPPGLSSLQSGPRFIAAEPTNELKDNSGIMIDIGKDNLQKISFPQYRTLIFKIMPIKESPAANFAIGLKKNNYVYWQKYSARNAGQYVEIPLDSSKIQEILINPALEGNDKGIELQGILLKK